jgi:hypothetical protein
MAVTKFYETTRRTVDHAQDEDEKSRKQAVLAYRERQGQIQEDEPSPYPDQEIVQAEEKPQEAGLCSSWSNPPDKKEASAQRLMADALDRRKKCQEQ